MLQGMTKIETLVSRFYAIAEQRGCAVSTLSRKVFNDGKTIDRLKRGGDLNTATYDRACSELDKMESQS